MPINIGNSERSAKRAINAVHDLLVRKAQAKAEAICDQWNGMRYASLDAKRLAPADVHDLNMYLFGSLDGGSIAELEAMTF